MEVHRSVLNRTSFPFYIGSREILLHWFTDRSLFKLFELITSIAALNIVASADIMTELDQPGRRVIASSCGGAIAIYFVLWSAHIIGTPARNCLEVTFGVILLLSLTASLYITIESYEGKTDSKADAKQGSCAILIISIMAQLGDLLCVLGCSYHKNCLYRRMFRKKQKMDARPRPMVNLRKKSTMYVREPTQLSFEGNDFEPIDEKLRI